VFIPGRSHGALQTGVMSCTVVAGFAGKEHKGKQPLFEKSSAKTFICAGPVAAKPARPKVNKVFCYFLFTKNSAFLAYSRFSLRRVWSAH
jgi:hypothetical protein